MGSPRHPTHLHLPTSDLPPAPRGIMWEGVERTWRTGMLGWVRRFRLIGLGALRVDEQGEGHNLRIWPAWDMEWQDSDSQTSNYFKKDPTNGTEIKGLKESPSAVPADLVVRHLFPTQLIQGQAFTGEPPYRSGKEEEESCLGKTPSTECS